MPRYVGQRSLETALLCRAVFILACLFFIHTTGVAAGCKPKVQELSSEVSYVYDGDTLKLSDGRIVRVIGINTPEMGRDGAPDQPGAVRARQRLMEILSANQNQVGLKIGHEPHDRYQRTLAHLYDSQGLSITEKLLREGLGYAVFIPPNLTNLDCYKMAERSARTRQLGLWEQGGHWLEAEQMTGREEGFHLIRGEVERIGKARRSLWLNLKRGPAIRIDWGDWDRFNAWTLDELVGKRLEARGWIYRRKGEQRMRVQHPASVHWLD